MSDDAIQRREDHLTDPLTFLQHLNLSAPQARLLHALSQLAPVHITPLAHHLGRDYANVFRSLQKLVSQGVVTRQKKGARVYYRLAQPRSKA